MFHVLVCDTTYRTAQAAIDRVFEEFNVDLRGKRVLIKPNALSEREPERAANTHPAVLEAVIKASRRAGASAVMVADNPGQANYGTIASMFAINGLGEVAGDTLRNFGVNLIPKRLPSLGDTDLYFPQLLFEVDWIINLPKLKVHPNVGLSSAVKNTFGYLPGAQKAACHVVARDMDHFEHILADIHTLRKPDLNIVDAILIPEGRPAGGEGVLRYIGKILASTSAAAVDVLAGTILGMSPVNLAHVARIAADDGVPLDVGKLCLTGDSWEIIPDIRLPQGFRQGEVRPTDAAKAGPSGSLQESASRKLLVLDREACTSCHACVDECPTGAATVGDDGFPHIDPGTCVSCFACKEVCEPDARELDPTIPDRV